VGSSVTATFVFTDLVDSTAIGARLGPDAAEAMRQAHFGILRQAAQQTGGVEVKTLGDGIMLMYTSPSRAVSCGVAIQQGIERHNHRAPEPLAVRVGIASGEATEEGGDFFGDAVVEASRLCAVAEGHQILTTELVRMLLGRNATHELVAVGELELKGIPEPVVVVEVRWEPDATPGVIPLPGRFVGAGAEGVFGFFGRAAEMRGIGDALKRAAVERRPNVVLLAGEPGIGKTTLAAQAARTAHAESATVLFGHCTEDLGAPYQPWIEALRHLVEHAPQELLDRHVEQHGGALARLVPALTQRTNVAASETTTDPDSERFLLFEAVSGLLAASAAQNPVAVVLDDFQWADAASVQLVRHLAGATTTASLLLLVTYRDSDIRRGHPLAALIGDLPRITTTERFILHGLDDREFVELVEGIAGHEMDENGLGFVHAIHRETDGNPFFTTEMLRHLWETGAIVLDNGRYVLSASIDEAGLPSSIRDVVGRRVERLGDEPARVLTAASIIGREFDLGVLADVTDTPEDQLLDLLDETVSASLIAEHPDVPGMYRFEHALIQHTLYDDLGVTRRQRMHQRVAEALERAGASSGRPAAELARHWLAATRPTEVAKALEYVRAAGDEALAALAPEDAIRWYQQALDLLDRQTTPDEHQRAELLAALGTTQRQAAHPEYRDTLLQAATLAQQLDDTDLVVRAALGFTQWSAGNVGDSAVKPVIQAALDRIGTEPTPTRARLLAALAAVHDASLEWQTRRKLSLQAIDTARQAGDDATFIDVIDKAHLALGTPDRRDQQIEDLKRAVLMADRIGDPALRARIRWSMLWARYQQADLTGADILLAEMAALTEMVGLPYQRWQLGIVTLGRLLLAGRVDEAETALEPTLEIGTAAEVPEAFGTFGAVLYLVRQHQGRLDEMGDLLIDVARDNPSIAVLRATVAQLLCELGRIDEARDRLAAEGASGFEFPYDVTWLDAMANLLDAAATTGDHATARTIIDRVAPFEGHVVSPTAVVVRGAIARPLARAAMLLDNYDQAESWFATAHDINARLGAPYLTARGQLDHADLCLARRADHDLQRARDLATTAAATAAEYGCAALSTRAANLLASVSNDDA
jgi:class 3 adenylate cyclase/tetratricopeptide (TPR) repeat protein